MKILYISSTMDGIHTKSIYSDLVNEFRDLGHDVTVIYAREKRHNLETELYSLNSINFLGVKTGNISKNTNLLKKGLATLNFDKVMIKAIKKHLPNFKFDLLLYSTPPIFAIKTLKYLKKSSPNGKLYLMLKDIFPQNAVDIGMIKPNGIPYRYFKRMETDLYSLFDYIGVMSPRNLEYFIEQNPLFNKSIKVLPNALKVSQHIVQSKRSEFGISDEKIVLFYGGNLGYPQDVPFVLKCFETIRYNPNIVMLIAGSGSQDYLIMDYINKNKPDNLIYLGQVSNSKFYDLTNLSDICLIFLDYRFTIPNFPQRILTSMECSKPIVCATDTSSDVGIIAKENKFGFWVPSNDPQSWYDRIMSLSNDHSLRLEMGQNSFKFFIENYTVNTAVDIILDQIGD